MQTDVWGSYEWISMSFKVFGSPVDFTPEHKIKYKQFFEMNTSVLPCEMCRTSFSTIMKYVDIDKFLDGRYSLCYWLFVVHNVVNRKLRKPLFESFSEYIFIYENSRARCGSKNDVEKFKKCMDSLEPYKMDAAKQISRDIKSKYEPIVRPMLQKLIDETEILIVKK
jgi:hypothetical protein